MRLFSGALLLALTVPSGAVVPPGSDAALGGLLDARSAGGAAFDGGRLLQSAPGAVSAGPGKGAPPLAPAKAADQAAAPQSPAAPADVQPSQARGVSDGNIGLYPENDFVVGTGRCSACRAPEEGKWYFLDEVIATPKVGAPALVWLGGHELLEGATLSDDGASLRLKDGSVVAFELVPKIESNRSYFDASSLAHLRGRALRLRGEYAVRGGVRTFVARTIWPEDYRVDAANLASSDAATAQDVDALVSADHGGARAPFQTKLLWQRSGEPRAWEGKPVMGVMLNGAQGDDDEALAGHFSLFTGRYGPGGSMADWMFNNFYDMNSESEKGIVASLVPMDKYMTDLNSGQSWYRPSELLVMVMKDERVPLQVQELFKQRYADYYAQKMKYEHTHLNCTALIADPVREAGWHFPKNGKTPVIVAKALSALASKVSGSAQAGEEIYQALREEPTRGFPRAAFDSVGGDLLSLEGANGADAHSRRLSPLEKMVQDDLVAILWVRLPQLPSSRKFGRDAVGGVVDYITRTGGKIKQTVPTAPRPFPPPH